MKNVYSLQEFLQDFLRYLFDGLSWFSNGNFQFSVPTKTVPTKCHLLLSLQQAGEEN